MVIYQIKKQNFCCLFEIFLSSGIIDRPLITRGANDVSRVRVQLSSSRVVNISSRARARVELT